MTADAGQQTKRILIVEDEAVTAMSLKSDLLSFGYEVIAIVASGEEAVIKAADLRPDLILMDIILKGRMNGIEAAEEIHKSLEIPVIYLTAHADEKTINRAKTTDPFGYLPKPCNTDTLISTIEVALYKSRADEQRRLAEKALMESEARYRRITEGLTDYQYTVYVREGRVVATTQSPACAAITGYTQEEFNNDPYLWIRMVAPEDREMVRDCVQQILSGKEIPPIEHRIQHKNGDMRWVSDTIIMNKDSFGNLLSYDGVIKDITERKKLEDQLRQSQKMEAIGVLAGGIAHDFNNILMAIIGFGSMAQKRLKDDPTTQEFIKEILKGADRAAELTRGLLAFSRKQVICPKKQDLNKIVSNIEKMLRRIMGEDIEFNTVLSDRAIMVNVDGAQIDQVLLNLTTNARDAMPDGGYLTVQTDTVNVDTGYAETHLFGHTGMYAVMIVSDTGKGMDQTTRENIFEPFFTTKGLGRGTGLGMAMVYGIIKQHDGNIIVYSELGKGTTFRIYLPLVKTDAVEKTETMEQLPAGKGETILIAEDDFNVRKILRMYLQEYGYNTIEADNGEEATIKFKEAPDKVSLLLLDVIMPVKNGRDAYEAIKVIRPDIKALYMSGYTDDIIAKRGVLQEGFDFISKPVTLDTLLKKVRTLLDR